MSVIPIVIGALRTIPIGLGNGLEVLKIGGQEDIKIGQNTKKSPGDLRRFTVTQNP